MRAESAWLIPVICAVVFASASAAEKPGTLSGVIHYTGDVPPATNIATADGGTIMHSDLVVDPKTKGLRFVVAVLENAPTQPKLTGAKAVTVDQRDMLFVPRIVAVQHGTAVSFDNSDTCNHSVMANSSVAANQFNVFVTPGKPHEHVFDIQKKPVMISCSLHGWMRAWVYVVPHPWFGVSDEHGKFEISEIPPGKYTIWLRHADTGREERREVEILPGKPTQLAFEWEGKK
jgi:plastocyanin